MAEKTQTTITDKAGFNIQVYDTSRFQQLQNNDKQAWELIRNSLIEIFPIPKNNIYDEMAIRFAENYAFILLAGMQQIVDTRVEQKIRLIEDRLNIKINQLENTINSLSAPVPTTTPTE